MKRSDWSRELPPKFDYTDKTPGERDLCIKLWMEDVKAEFALYKRTRNGAHMWRCYQLWRRLLPDDLPLPRELLSYFDQCADAIATETEPEAIKKAMGLLKPPSDIAEHGGGHTGGTDADSKRKQRDVMDFICTELVNARTRSAPAMPPRGYKGAIYEKASAKFGYKKSTIKELVHKWSVAEIVDRRFRKWRDRGM